MSINALERLHLGDDAHNAIASRQNSGVVTNHDWFVTCSCGATWTHPASADADKVASVFASHLRYFNRAPMTTL